MKAISRKACVVALFISTGSSAMAASRVEIVTNGDVSIETVVDGNGPAVVILPSLGRDGYEDYNAAAELLARDGFKVLRPQPRGIGKSKGPMNGVTYYDLAQDITAVIDKLGDRQAIMVGHAYGQFISRILAARYPERIRGVVIAAGAASDTRDRFPLVWRAPRYAANPAIADEDRLASLKGAFFSNGNNAASWLQGWYPDVSKMEVAASVPRESWWGAGNAPLLELIPEDDPFKPKDRWKEMRREFGERVTTVIIPDASHALFPEQPEAIAEAISSWSKKLYR
ncbi:alpha/beta fold hydrolase [Brucella haematophila]|nr:alpha/beta hydrolase [Brucella haematophila]TMV04366.1 alpha/beta hydrolase [Brucella haematophila]